MKIRKVSIQNLNSLRLKKTIPFDEPPLSQVGLFAITGDTGAGKTTILDAITLALYGEVHRNKDVKEVLSYGATEAVAEVEFEVRGDIYLSRWSVWRARGKVDGNFQGPKREVAKWNVEKQDFEIVAEKINESRAYIEEVTGLDYGRFCRSVLLSQGDFAAFLKASERERSELLERITGTDIYSRLSVAAYERHKIEGEALQRLQQQLEALSLLPVDELEALQTELSEKQKEEKAEREKLNGLREQIQWLEKIEHLKQQQASYEEQVQELERARQAMKPEEEQLRLHRLALPARPDIARLEDTEAEQAQLEKQLAELESRLPQLKEKLEAAKAERKAAESSRIKQETAQQEQKPVIEKVLELDLGIQEKETPLQELREEQQSEQSDIKTLESQCEALEQNIKNNQARIKEASDWLAANKDRSKLSADLPAIRQQREQLGELYRKIRASRKQIKTLEDQEVAQQSKIQQSAKTLKKEQLALDKLRVKFKKELPSSFAAERSDLLSQLHEKIEHLNGQKQNLEALFQLDEAYRESLAELAKYEEELEQLQNTEWVVGNNLMTSFEQLEQFRQQLEYKRAIYEQQRLIANYEADRAELEEGEECPLCFSTHHPFRDKDIKPYVDKAKKELEKAEQQHEKEYKHHKELLDHHKEIINRINHLSGDEVKQLSGQVDNHYDRILSYEQKMVEVAPSLRGVDFSRSRTHLLSEKIKESEQSIKNLQKARTRLSKTIQELEKKEKTLAEQEKALDRLEAAASVIANSLKLTRENLIEQEADFENLRKEVNHLLKPYGFTFDLETAADTFKMLEHRQREWSKKQEEAEQLAQGQKLAQQKLLQYQEQSEEKKEKLAKLAARIQKSQSRLEALRAERSQLFGEKDPRTERDKLAKALQTAEEKSKAIQSSLNALEKEESSLQQSRRDKRDQQQALNKKSTQLQAALEQAAVKAAFTTVAELRSALLPDEAAATLENKINQLAQDERDAQQGLKSVHAQLTEEQGRQLTDLPEKEIREQLLHLEEAYAQSQRLIGASEEKVRQQQEGRAQAAALTHKLEAQRKEYYRWSKLNDIIGMADGKKFRTFAQGLTLQRLTSLANEHLQRLNGRYLIQKRSDEDLELDIIDTYQANNRRSMNTLSGGESFLVSLALALGLSDLAGRNTQIQSLFIDEGFGTLDENALDMAIATLENLQASGKTIGIISHVKALKERIGTQIVVQKRGDGFSEVMIPNR